MVRAVLTLAWLCTYLVTTQAKVNDANPEYSNSWIAKIEGGDGVASRIARDLGYTYREQVGQINDYYEMVREDLPKVSLTESKHFTRSLLEQDEVKWAKQQVFVKHSVHPSVPVFPDYLYGYSGLYSEESQQNALFEFLNNEYQRQISKGLTDSCPIMFPCITRYPINVLMYLRKVGQTDISTLGTYSTKPAPQRQLNTYSHPTFSVGLLTKKVSAYALRYTDPGWRYQWYMQDYRTMNIPVMDLNVVPAHNMGYSGKGVTVAVVDSGVEGTHPDLKQNFVSQLSYDMCSDVAGVCPDDDSHGTNCAGVIAMVANNTHCGVGVAYEAKIVGLKALCETMQTGTATAKALGHRVDKIDIYSNSWGVYGQGTVVSTLDHLTEAAFTLGTQEGRGKKGVIYVRSAGNDKDVGDNCAVDGEINNPYVITITGADQWGSPVYYAERCTAIFAATYTKNKKTEPIVAPDLKGKCSASFSGTSAACPLASGIIALALQANPELTYRDVMHLITMSAEVAPLADNRNTWYKNGRGFWVSNDFGFGLMNAENMVTLARDWTNVGKHRTCIISATVDDLPVLSYQSRVQLEFDTTACKGTEDEVNFLEHVELATEAPFPHRGAMMVFIISPEKTRSQLLETRYKDYDEDGLEGWGILSTHNWGENPRGTWILNYVISQLSHPRNEGYVKSFTLVLHGTKEMPAHYKRRRTYAAFRLPNLRTSLL